MPDSSISRSLPLLLAVSVFMQLLDATILNTALPSIAADLNASPLRMQSVIIAYALSMALFMPLSGYLSDRFGTRRVFFWAMAIFTLGSFLCAMAPHLNFLIFSRAIQGMGGAMLLPVPRLIILRAYHQTDYISKMNFVIMPALLGPIVGPVVGGYLVEYFSWQWIFLINLPIGLLGLMATRKILPNFFAPHRQTVRLDYWGFVLFATGAMSISLAVEWLSYPAMMQWAVSGIMMGLLAWLFYWQHAKKWGLLALYPLQLGMIRTFRIGIIGNTSSRLGMAAVPFLLPLLLQVVFHYSPSLSGWTLIPIALAAVLAKPMVKPLIRRFGYRNVLVWNSRAIGSIIILFALPTPNTPIFILLPLLMALGWCNSIQYSAMNTLTLCKLRPEQAASGNSLMAVNQQLSISIGIAMGASLLNLFNFILDENSIHLAFQYTFLMIGSITFLSSWVFSHLHHRDGYHLIAS